MRSLLLALPVLLGFLGLSGAARAAEPFVVRPVEVTDRKVVFATVESVDRTVARARIAGTLEELAVDEGDTVAEGQVLARIDDPKLRLEQIAIEAQIKALEADRELARIELERARTLRKRNAVPQARLDEALANFRVIEARIAAEEARRDVVLQQLEEGKVRAPVDGRVLRVRVTEGTVMMPGEVLADIATEQYILRARLPERHARFVAEGDTVWIGPRGLASDEPVGKGKIVKVYPELEAGRVVVDIEATGIGGYFIGERARVALDTGERTVFLVPPEYVGQRFGVDFVILESGEEVVVQRGMTRDGRLEILAGLEAGDRLLPVESHP